MIAIHDALWAQLLLTLLLSFLTGSELRSYQIKYHAQDKELFFGTVRTLSLTGVMGAVFYLLSPWLFMVGYVAITALFLLLYWVRLQQQHGSMLSFLVWSMTYAYGPLIMEQPLWVASSVFVVTVLLLNAKQSLNQWFQHLDNEEFSTLAKLLLLSVVVLPLLPHENIHQWVPVSPFKVWLAVVVVSSISYLGYVFQKYIFKGQGLLVTGIFGGLYSSTATTVVLAKKSQEVPRLSYKMTAAIVIATGLMYLRLWVIAALFLWPVAWSLLLPMSLLAIASFVIAFVYMEMEKRRGVQKTVETQEVQNPLELKVAFVFAALFVLMAVVTQVVMHFYGDAGLKYLALIVGFTDIDPFVLSLLNGTYHTQASMIAGAILIAAGSNNLLKAVYAWVLGEPKAGHYSAFWLSALGVVTIALGWFLYS
jgi:uncharacterized membrane protein (DUF4010 family)